MNTLKLIRTRLSNEQLTKVCKLGKGAKTCPFLSYYDGIFECCHFTREGLVIDRKIREKNGDLKNFGCNYIIEQFLEIKSDFIKNKVVYIDQPNDEQKFLVDFMFDPEKRNFSIMMKTERDILPFAFSINPRFICLKETNKNFIIYNLIGFKPTGVSISK
jgi:hypothetical protein